MLLKTQNSILSAAVVLAMSSGVNALLGFVKSRLLARYFGVSSDLAIFYTADRIPNLFYSILIVGAISTVFIPLFTGVLKQSKEEAFKMASAIVTETVMFFLLLGSVLFIGAPYIISVLSVGKFTPDQVALGAGLMRMMLTAQLILVISSLITSVLQSFKYFLIPAFAPIAYNIGMILGIVFLSEKIGIYGPTIGVMLGAILHLAVQIPVLAKTGFKFRFSFNLKDRSVRQMVSLVPPRILSVLISNLIDTVNNSLAILVSTSAVVFLKFAMQLQAFPINFFGFSIASASLPTLSSESDEENLKTFKKTFLTSFHQMMFLVIPASLILLILRVPVVRIVYGVSNFPWEATIQTSYALAFFSLSIFSQSANQLLTRAFYAFKDTMTPVLISIGTVILNVGLSVTFVVLLKLGVWSVALAYSITSILDMILLFYFLSKKVGGFDLYNVIAPFTKISFAAIFMGVTIYVPLKLLDQYIFDTSRTVNLILLTGIAGLCGMITYLMFTKLFKVYEIELLYKLARKLNLTRKNINIVQTEESSL